MPVNSDDASLLELRLFGQPSVCVLGDDITRSLPKKAILLLAMLALREGRAIERSHVAATLWPNVSETAALHNLRQMLAALRRSLLKARDLVLSPSPRSISLELS